MEKRKRRKSNPDSNKDLLAELKQLRMEVVYLKIERLSLGAGTPRNWQGNCHYRIKAEIYIGSIIESSKYNPETTIAIILKLEERG